VLPDVGELLAKHDVANLFWIGDRALGRQTGRDAPFVLAFDDDRAAANLGRAGRHHC
jgi:hypothetical protein